MMNLPKRGMEGAKMPIRAIPLVGYFRPIIDWIRPFICPFVGFAHPLVPRPIPVHVRTSPGTLPHRQRGLTIIELMVTLGVLAITAAIAYPSFDAYVANSRLVTSANELTASIQLARAEALRRGVTTVLCRSANPGAATPTCGGTANNWSTGWLIYALPDTSGERDYDSSTDTLIKTGPGAQTNVTITADTTANAWLAFKRDGTLNETAEANYSICDSRGASQGRLISISLTGRPNASRTIAGNADKDCTPT